MTDQQILQKAIEKAVKNGYSKHGFSRLEPMYQEYRKRWVFGAETPFDKDRFVYEYINIELIIFSHEFAQAFWGEKVEYIVEPIYKEDDICRFCKVSKRFHYRMKCWQYHLQQMVLEKNPIRYLEKFI